MFYFHKFVFKKCCFQCFTTRSITLFSEITWKCHVKMWQSSKKIVKIICKKHNTITKLSCFMCYWALFCSSVAAISKYDPERPKPFFSLDLLLVVHSASRLFAVVLDVDVTSEASQTELLKWKLKVGVTCFGVTFSLLFLGWALPGTGTCITTFFFLKWAVIFPKLWGEKVSK